MRTNGKTTLTSSFLNSVFTKTKFNAKFKFKLHTKLQHKQINLYADISLHKVLHGNNTCSVKL